MPEMALPCVSVTLPVKFTRRGTGADDCVDAPCWAATTEQIIEIVRDMESENLQDFMAHLNSSVLSNTLVIAQRLLILRLF
jgi:hypothetical protein